MLSRQVAALLTLFAALFAHMTASAEPQQYSPSTTSSPTILLVTGRVLTDIGQIVPASVRLICGTNTLNVVKADLRGYFSFDLGAQIQGNADLSASDYTPQQYSPKGMGRGDLREIASSTSSRLLGCELHVSAPGYAQSITTLRDTADFGSIAVGTIHLHRIGGAHGFTVSVTSLLVPDNARKEFDKAKDDLRKNRLASATQHLERAVAQFDKYAVAWNELGSMYLANHAMGKAKEAYLRAIASDPRYVMPLVRLAALELQTQRYESAIEQAGKALELDPGIAVAGFIQAAAYFELDRLDDAEKRAQLVEKEEHQDVSQVHLLLADIFLRKRDYSGAAAQMQAYLKESPQGPVVEGVKNDLARIEQSIVQH